MQGGGSPACCHRDRRRTFGILESSTKDEISEQTAREEEGERVGAEQMEAG